MVLSKTIKKRSSKKKIGISKAIKKKLIRKKKTIKKALIRIENSSQKSLIKKSNTKKSQKNLKKKSSKRILDKHSKKTTKVESSLVKSTREFNFKKELKKIDISQSPKHVAIILDGNGRWAKSKGLSRSDGHRAGGETLDRLLDFFIELNVSVVSLYAFSTENWKRPNAEVKAIWKLLNEFFKSRSGRAMEKGICIRASGNIDELPFRSRRIIQKVIKKTKNNQNLIANFCVNYGSRDEIMQVATKIALDRIELWKAGQKKMSQKPVEIDEFEKHLFTEGLPDVDLLVRPGGEFRISNFLLWQCAYAEFYITDTLWPDFTEKNIIEAVHWYQKRNRRFGGL